MPLTMAAHAGGHPMAEVKLPRRDFLKAAGAAGATGAAMASGLAACSPETKTSAAAASGPETWQVLTQQEVAFFTAAADTIIPKDELSPSGSECGIPTFVDRQLRSEERRVGKECRSRWS